MKKQTMSEATRKKISNTVAKKFPVEFERRRQVQAEGYDESHDDRHDLGELARAAECYARVGRGHYPSRSPLVTGPWPFELSELKTSNAHGDIDFRRCLIKAGALAMAERDRLARFIRTIKKDLER